LFDGGDECDWHSNFPSDMKVFLAGR
jgi:hypothetical protein